MKALLTLFIEICKVVVYQTICLFFYSFEMHDRYAECRMTESVLQVHSIERLEWH